jgi:hypothetical protein
VNGKEVQHATEKHGFPQCPHCTESFERWDNFYRHVNGHTFNPCGFPGCEELVLDGQEGKHAVEKHGFPICPSGCTKEFVRWDKFYSHVRKQKCTKARETPCPYPECPETVFLNRPSLTRGHFVAGHGGMACENCGLDSAMSITLFMNHVRACCENRDGVSCGECGTMFETPHQKSSHHCVPVECAAGGPRLTFNEFMEQQEQRTTVVHVKSSLKGAGPPRRAVVQIRRSTFHQGHWPQLSDGQKKRGFPMTRDPTTVELISLGELPTILLFLPREESFESRVRILHELEQYQSEWVMWALLVTRIANLARHLGAADVEFLGVILRRVALPPGVPEKFRDLNICRAHTHLIKERGYNHAHLSTFYQTDQGFRPLHAHLRTLERAKQFPTIKMLEERQMPDAPGETPRSMMDVIERRWDGFLYHFFREVVCPVLGCGLFERLRTWNDVAIHFLGENLPRLNVTAKRVEIKYRPDQANDWGVRSALRLAEASNKRVVADTARLRSDDCGIKGNELQVILDKLKDFAYSPTPLDPFQAPPLHPHVSRRKRARLAAADVYNYPVSAFETASTRHAEIFSGYAYLLAGKMTEENFIKWSDAMSS